MTTNTSTATVKAQAKQAAIARRAPAAPAVPSAATVSNSLSAASAPLEDKLFASFAAAPAPSNPAPVGGGGARPESPNFPAPSFPVYVQPGASPGIYDPFRMPSADDMLNR